MRIKAFLALWLLNMGLVFGQTPQLVVSDPEENITVKNRLSYLEVKQDTLSYEQVKRLPFQQIENKDVPNFKVSSSTFWIRLDVKNETDFKELILQVSLPLLDKVVFYDSTRQGLNRIELGEHKDFSERPYSDPNYLFPLSMEKGEARQVYLKIQGKENVQVPVVVGTSKSILEMNKLRDLVSGLYLGIMLVMLLYNAFIYTTTRDKAYVWYVVYLICVILTQSSIQGYSFQFLWPGWPKLAMYNSFLFPTIVGISGMQFMRIFLNTKEHSHTFERIFYIVSAAYIIGTLLSFIDLFKLSFLIIEICASIAAFSMLILAIRIARQGYRPALFFTIAWSVFLFGVAIYVMKDFGFLPYNNFTYYVMPIGSAIEVMLLSFALADRINILKREKEESQAQALKISQENERIIREQNIILEKKVKERTAELEETNEELTVTLNHLKETQAQLVDAEKMASLGQLTAGIAHEINNPINFVSANVEPLRMDIQDVMEVVDRFVEALEGEEVDQQKIKEAREFMEEIDFEYIREEVGQLLKGIGDGAVRTAEIVKGLKTFSRLDESDLKPADLNEGLQSTLVILRNSISDNIELITEYGDIQPVECFPGKINQVFMNILNNAIQAMSSEGYEKKQKLIVSTEGDSKEVRVHIRDTGPGIPDELKNKIFEPFFTTKEVGEGTGLGLSIVFKIIETHGGSIRVESELGKGTEFIITLPVVAKVTDDD